LLCLEPNIGLNITNYLRQFPFINMTQVYKEKQNKQNERIILIMEELNSTLDQYYEIGKELESVSKSRKLVDTDHIMN